MGGLHNGTWESRKTGRDTDPGDRLQVEWGFFSGQGIRGRRYRVGHRGGSTLRRGLGTGVSPR